MAQICLAVVVLLTYHSWLPFVTAEECTDTDTDTLSIFQKNLQVELRPRDSGAALTQKTVNVQSPEEQNSTEAAEAVAKAELDRVAAEAAIAAEAYLAYVASRAENETVTSETADSENGSVTNVTTVKTVNENKTLPGELDSLSRKNGTNVSTNSSKQEEAFVKKTTKQRGETRTVEHAINETVHAEETNTTDTTEEIVVVAQPAQILTVFICIFTPLAVAWACYIHYGQQEKHAYILFPIMMGCFSVGFDLVNQSLALVMEVPAAITAFQALGMAIFMLFWSVYADREQAQEVSRYQWLSWLFVAFIYSLYQLANHLAYNKCSLSERTVFLNLGPVMGILLEMVLLPRILQKSTTFRTKIALFCMVAGSVLFSIQIPDFTAGGVSSAVLLMTSQVAARLAQRSFLGNPDSKIVPIGPLVVVDGFVLFMASGLIATTEMRTFWDNWDKWTSDSSIALMLILSVLTMAGHHTCTLILLKNMSSATTVLVYSNVVSILNVVFGILWFGDQAFATVASMIGLFVSLASGIWYSAEVVIFDVKKTEALADTDGEALKLSSDGKFAEVGISAQQLLESAASSSNDKSAEVVK